MVEDFTLWTGPILEDGEVWRIYSMGLLHIAPSHILLNMIWLGYVGWALERAMGRLNLLLIYFASVFGGSLFSMFLTPENPSLGASGGVFGLVAAAVVFGFSRPELLGEKNRRFFGFALLPYLALMFLGGLRNPGIDNWCHFGGLITGATLAVALDPLETSRKAARLVQNRTIIIVALVGTPIAIALAGPRLVRVGDSHEVRLATLRAANPDYFSSDKNRPPVYQALSFDVPLGWAPGINLAGDLGWVSPRGKRVWSVVEKHHPTPVTASKVVDEWTNRLGARGLTRTAGDSRSVEIDGRQGFQTDFLIGRDGEHPNVTRLSVVTRGEWSLLLAWQCDASSESRLEPVYQKLFESVKWDDPESLVEARANLRVRPNAARFQAELARARGEVGEVDEALEIWLRLLDEKPDDRDSWEGLLHLMTQWPDRIDTAQVLIERALHDTGHSKVIVAVSDVLAAQGQQIQANGLLELAWLHRPGDRSLRHARRSAGLTVTLDPESQLPTDAVYDPINQAPVASTEVRRWQLEPLTLASADEYGQMRYLVRRQVSSRAAERLAARDRAALRDLAWLKFGTPPTEDASDTLAALNIDLKQLAEGEEVRWAEPEVRAAIRELPGVWLLALDEVSEVEAKELLIP